MYPGTEYSTVVESGVAPSNLDDRSNRFAFPHAIGLPHLHSVVDEEELHRGGSVRCIGRNLTV